MLSTAINLIVTISSIPGAIATSSTNPVEVSRALEEAASGFEMDKDSLKRAFWKARRRGLLERKRARGKEYWRATKLGRERLSSIIPTYRNERPWDKRLYLVTYDIPEEKHSQRTKLRGMLIGLGAGRFQDSVYLMLWDPTDTLRRFIHDHGIAGSVVVSDTGTDGSIGERNLHDLIWDVFQLEELNNRYQAFLRETTQRQGQTAQLIFHFLSILRDDPQLPFGLQGPLWNGDKAYKAYRTLLTSPPVTS